MNALIIHYHLKPGGVTTVIRRQLASLAKKGIAATVLCGEAPAGFGGAASVEPALAYDAPGDAGVDTARVGAIVRSIRREAAALGGDTVVHVHNPTIRKNSALLPALSELAASGTRLLLHVHDLAEDWRPDVYSAAAYPEGAAWAAINRFDADALAKAGALSVSFLPNPVPCPSHDGQGSPLSAADRPRGPGLFLYPVRGIRRKNLGEALLLSMFARPGSSIGVTLPPNSPGDAPRYDAWLRLAASLGAPIAFGLGLQRSLDELYAQARAVVTTSVKEGFGLSYLESAARGRVAFGRRLERVAPDFEAEGLSFPGLYRRLSVPPSLFDGDGFAARVERVVDEAASAYGRPEAGASMARDIVESVFVSARGGPDFGRLDEEAQAEALHSIASDATLRSAFVAANPAIDGWDAEADELEPPPLADLAPWSEAAYGERLASAYSAVLGGASLGAPDKKALLDRYLVAESFHGVGV